MQSTALRSERSRAVFFSYNRNQDVKMLFQLICIASFFMVNPVIAPSDSMNSLRTAENSAVCSERCDQIHPVVAHNYSEYQRLDYSRFSGKKRDENSETGPVEKRNRLYDILNLYERDIVRMSGRLYFDAAYVNQANEKIESDIESVERVTNSEFGTLVRSARLRAEGAITSKTRWRAEMEVIDRLFTFRGFFIQYNYRDNIQFLFGNIIKEPMGIERMSPLGWYPFLELAPSVGTFMPDRNLSFRAEYRRQRFSLMVSVLSGVESIYDSAARSGYAIAGRSAYAPFVTEHYWLHIGGHGAVRVNALATLSSNIASKYEPLVLSTRSGSRAAGIPVVGVLPIEDVRTVNRYGADFAFGYGRLYTQYEWTGVLLNRDVNHSTLNLGGYYLQSGYFLTDDRRPYRPSQGNFGPVHPRKPFIGGRGTGAVEIAIRYSDTRTNDRDYRGGDIRQLAFALNWYLDSDTRLMLNYVLHNSERMDGLTYNGNVFAIRLNFEF